MRHKRRISQLNRYVLAVDSSCKCTTNSGVKETSASVRVEMNRCGSEHNRGIPPWRENTERTGLSGGCRVTGIPTTTKADEIL